MKYSLIGDQMVPGTGEHNSCEMKQKIYKQLYNNAVRDKVYSNGNKNAIQYRNVYRNKIKINTPI